MRIPTRRRRVSAPTTSNAKTPPTPTPTSFPHSSTPSTPAPPQKNRRNPPHHLRRLRNTPSSKANSPARKATTATPRIPESGSTSEFERPGRVCGNHGGQPPLRSRAKTPARVPDTPERPSSTVSHLTRSGSRSCRQDSHKAAMPPSMTIPGDGPGNLANLVAASKPR